MLDQALGLFDDHFGDLDVAGGGLVEGRGDDLALHGALHVGDFLGPLVDQEDHEVAFGVVGLDRLGDVLQHHGLADPGGGDDQAALAFAERRDDVDDPPRTILHRRIGQLHGQALVGIQRREVIESDLVADVFRVFEIDQGDAGQGEIALAFLGRADGAVDGITGAQAELSDL